MKKKTTICLGMLILALSFALAGCSSGGSSSSSSDWKKDAADLGYKKSSDGKWYK